MTQNKQALIALRARLLSPATFETIQKNLPPGIAKYITGERLARIALSTAGRNADILKCSPVSIIKCVVEAAQYGLSLAGGPLAQAFLVPYKQECNLIITWQGLVALARRGGEVVDVSANCIYSGDKYIYREGFDATFSHEPNLECKKEDKDIIAAYCVTYYANGHKAIQVMPRSEIEKRRQASPSAGSKSSPWSNWFPEMAIKSVIKAAAKRWPKTEELSSVLLKEDETEGFITRDVFESDLDDESENEGMPQLTDPLQAVLSAIECANNASDLGAIRAQVDALHGDNLQQADAAYKARDEELTKAAGLSKSANAVMQKVAITPRARVEEKPPWDKHLPMQNEETVS